MNVIDRSHLLAVLAPTVGAPSETFVRRHMCDLLPGHTAVVTGQALPPERRAWGVDGPLLDLSQVYPRRWERLRDRCFRRSGDLQTRRALSFLRSHRVEVVLGEWLDFSAPWFEALRLTDLRFFAHAHGYDVSRAWLAKADWKENYRRFNAAAGVIVMSETCRRALVSIGLSAARIHVIPYGVDVSSHPPEPIPASDRIIRCLAVGRMVGKKAPIVLLDAFRRAAELFPQLQLDYIGGGNLLAAAQQYVRICELGDRVRLHGTATHDAVVSAMRRADIFLQHSVTDSDTGDEEGLPVAILEAMAAGLPVISTHHAGIPEAVAEGETGILVDEWDSRGMSEAILNCAHDAALRRRLGHAGWQRAKEMYSWEKERAQLLDVLGLT